MFDIVAQNAGIILFGLVVMWLIQFGLAYRQMRRFYSRLVELRRDGLTAVGLNGERFKGRSYAVLTIDEHGQIIHAEKFSGWTVFAKLQPVAELRGMSLAELLEQERQLPVPAKLRPAFGNAARDLQAARKPGVVTPPALGMA